MGKRKSIALLVYSEPQTYPPTINAANILAEKGYLVYLYGIKYDTKDKVALHPNIKMHYWGKQEMGIKNVLKYASVYLRLLKDSIRYKFDWMIAYDAFAVGPAYFVAKIRNIKWVYHQHDWWEQPIGVFQKWVNKKEFQWGSKATLVSFPQEHRAKLFQEKTGMKNLPLIVYNGPRLSWIAKKPVLHPALEEIKKKYEQVLIYQGGLSVYFSLENLVRALPLVSTKVALLFLGRALDDKIEQSLQEVAQQEKVADQIFYWHEYVSYDQLPDITSFCTIGITKLTHNDMYAPVNDRFIAGASNKIAEYMAAGLPIISSDTEDNKAFYSKHDIGLLCDTTKPAAIAAAIHKILEDKEFATDMATRNSNNFLQEYNYDVQFAKIEKIIAG